MEPVIPKHPVWCDYSRCTVSAENTNGSHASRTMIVVDDDRALTIRLVRPDQRTDAARQVIQPGYRPSMLVIEPSDSPAALTVPVSVRQAHLLGRILRRTPIVA